MGFFDRKPEMHAKQEKPGVTLIQKFESIEDVEKTLKLYSDKHMTRAEADLLLRTIGGKLPEFKPSKLAAEVIKVFIDDQPRYITLYTFNGQPTISETHDFPHQPKEKGAN